MDDCQAVTNLTNAQCQQLIALLSGKLAFTNTISSSHETSTGNYYILNLTTGYYKSNVWILDSGATRHICNDKVLFVGMKKITDTRVSLLNQSKIYIHYIGDFKTNSHIQLRDVLFVPEFELDLISITSITNPGTISVKFYHYFALIKQLKDMKMIGRGRVQAGLYVLEDSPHSSMVFVNVVSCQQWHQRFSHPPVNKLKMLDSILVSDKDFDKTPCVTCPLAKRKKLSFPSSNNVKLNPFDLVH